MSSKYLCCGPKMPSYVRGRMSVWGQVGSSGENLGYRPSHIRVGTKVLAKTKNILTNPLRIKSFSYQLYLQFVVNIVYHL